jgi:ABC-2 type transport system permease protein
MSLRAPMTSLAPATPPSPPVPAIGHARGLVEFYLASIRLAIADQFQYRVANYFYMIGMVAEPVIYLVVWSTIAEQQGGQVGGFTPGQFAAYYIVWTLVRNMNIIFTPYGWEERIRTGELSGMLLRPLHPIHNDLAYFAGWKFVVIVLWLPIAGVLALLFSPELNPRPIDVVVFAVAIWGAYLIRSVNYWILGMVTFWTTRVGPIFELVFTAELLLSGRLVPLSLMPEWAQQLADVLPFKWTFGFPIEALVAGLPEAELLGGLGMQALWIAIGSLGVLVVWRFAIRRYSAVGN